MVHNIYRLSSQIKQRSPLITQNPIAYYPHQIAIARQQKQTRLPNSPKLNSDRHLIIHKPDRLNLKIKQRSPFLHLVPDIQ
ncbi:MAG: hypothetical protein ACK5EU_06230 [Pseudanabaena sp.]|jgi:hypothetical protein|uniref:hypothetical protein n=1 Tax=Pseudanabaena mucicola TaxID=71190 RepID=UPI002577EFC5|nr:hypothetical protein [Pseudanabaena mucicola]MCA6574313.1 hypothetical protein [Pseudanabaena sp. M53BS1SP1A06MG]MCA6581446.1 hypothetical protein [Pseudanabaena sp. M34BS1SP1A06MG]MCA6588478.1 hypothetical protein [Pseudanabaena sp. M109S1SP1A06QC]MCA6591269.1 hypothetical protein [Pseudanabaena sp. M38BS1SP1A06MG]MCA6601719.1 hypothetical protein [Pseudanabaena sp. M57BS1SP1A06MG]MCA6604610.1 hypothetical protein [Pseudanabaena sp. M007S1SP1A06QC]MCA6615342.1 hypothetical protein [Pseud